MSKKISAIIACYKDVLSVPVMHSRLTKIFKLLDVEYEIIFVNDGSPDASRLVISELARKDVHVIGIHHSRNFGSQMAFLSGMKVSTGDAVVLMDGDLQDPPEIIPNFVDSWKKGNKVVYGIRSSRDSSFFMQVMYKLFYRLFHSLSYVTIPLDAGDFSLIDRDVVNVLLSFPERDVFLRGLRAWVGFPQTGVKYVRPERIYGTTTNSLLKNFEWATKGIFSFSFIPLKFMTLFSMCVFFISCVGIIVQIVLRILLPQTPQGISTVIVIVLFLGSVQMLGLSILGEYIGKIFEETKHRPPFIIQHIDAYPKKKTRLSRKSRILVG